MVYNIDLHHSVIESVLGREAPYLLGFFYPPIFLLMIFPFALLSYRYALFIWILLTTSAYLFTVNKILPGKLSIMAALAFPGTLMNLLWGQNGFLTAFLLGNGILLIESNPMLSGLMFGLLCYKPHFAFLPLLVLLIGRHWKALIWSVFFAGASVFTSVVIFGLKTWREYLNTIPSSANLALVEDWASVSGIQTTFYTFSRLITDNYQLSLIIQTFVSIIIIIIVCLVWRYISSKLIRNIVLSSGILLTTPYAMQYDLVILALPIFWYCKEIINTELLKGEFAVLLFLFFMPMINLPIVHLTHIQIAPIAVTLLLIILFRRIHCLYWPINILKLNGSKV